MSELLLDWRAWAVVLFLSGITLISSTAKYQIGEKGLPIVQKKFPQVSPERWERIGSYVQRWGSSPVILSFLPILGTLIPPAAGAYGVPFRIFLFWAFLAKLLRYWLLLLFVFGGAQLIF